MKNVPMSRALLVGLLYHCSYCALLIGCTSSRMTDAFQLYHVLPLGGHSVELSSSLPNSMLSKKSMRSNSLDLLQIKGIDQIMHHSSTELNISKKRRQQLGIPDEEREYDLGVALQTNTDPLITKIIAGSFILVMIALLVVGLVIPYTTDLGEGVCNPIQNGGRC